MTPSLESLLKKYPEAKVASVRHALDEVTFRAQKMKHEQRQAEGAAIGVIWLGSSAVVLAKRTRMDLHPGWSLLGGTVEKGRAFDEEFVREAKEEAGIEVQIDRLVLVEQKVFIAPNGQEVSLDLAVFEATALPGEQLIRTPEAKKEGLEVKAFALNELPAEMVLKDREKLEQILTVR
jgi:ADP-ribose pyrophosphatase YjhB (NUDIX family)